MHTDSIEVWMPVPGYEGLYCVSSLGRVRSNVFSPRLSPDRILSSHPTGRSGYVAVCVAGQSRRVHTLVALAFIGPPPEETSVNHIDGVKTNNRADNLEYLTRNGQMAHAKAIGLIKPPAFRPASDKPHGWHNDPERIPRGESHGMAKLTPDQVREIRRRRAAGETGAGLSREFGVNPRTIRAIVNGGRWDHLR